MRGEVNLTFVSFTRPSVQKTRAVNSGAGTVPPAAPCRPSDARGIRMEQADRSALFALSSVCFKAGHRPVPDVWCRLAFKALFVTFLCRRVARRGQPLRGA